MKRNVLHQKMVFLKPKIHHPNSCCVLLVFLRLLLKYSGCFNLWNMNFQITKSSKFFGLWKSSSKKYDFWCILFLSGNQDFIFIRNANSIFNLRMAFCRIIWKTFTARKYRCSMWPWKFRVRNLVARKRWIRHRSASLSLILAFQVRQ